MARFHVTEAAAILHRNMKQIVHVETLRETTAAVPRVFLIDLEEKGCLVPNRLNRHPLS